MGCCKPYQFPFANIAFSSIPYTDDMKANLGPTPKVDIYYWDPKTEDYYATNGGLGSQVKFDGTTISIDHGGLATGIVKVS